MRFGYLWIIAFVLLGAPAFQSGLGRHWLVAQSRDAENAAEGLTASEKEALQKAKDPEEQVRFYLEIASDRLKTILSSSRRGDDENTAKAVTGFRTAVSEAEETVAKGQAVGKSMKRSLTAVLKATKKYNPSLLQALERVPEDQRGHIQSAYEASQRVQDGVALQLERVGRK
jgi:hypothetical protein